MHDLRWIRDNPEEFDRGLVRRFLRPCADEVLALDRKWRALETQAQEAQTLRNRLSREVGAAKSRGESADELLAQIANGRETEARNQAEANELRRQIDDLLAGLPNLPAPDVPDGPDESANKEVRRHSQPPRFNFAPLSHETIGDKLGLMDLARAAKLSGSRFVVLKGALARLERALGQFMLDLHTREFGYEEISPPLLVRDDAVFGTSQLPKFAEDLFQTREGYWLIPTSEVPLANLVAGEILDEAALPLRLTAWTPCFRSEAGAAGKDTRGMIRQHQFEKVELISITRPEDSETEHERMTACAEEVLKRLGLAYRVVVLSTGDMGFAARKTYDIEVWLPGQNTYREISSCSNCGAFQALRMKARYRPAGGKGTAPVHTLNGSGLAIGRTLIAILENFQRHNGAVAIPEALRPYMGGQDLIEPVG
ncbi:MAG TPA: serine--tRNA ligase [Candidatus Dormibacteraeota bacterium]|nr:serine--tRNA ligase [Candidatus Dormibacteraeota bacterium]HEX2680080.1 serine--tRNA ligase [Candidatus Dormibacteraeota bacterium]